MKMIAVEGKGIKWTNNKVFYSRARETQKPTDRKKKNTHTHKRSRKWGNEIKRRRKKKSFTKSCRITKINKRGAHFRTPKRFFLPANAVIIATLFASKQKRHHHFNASESQERETEKVWRLVCVCVCCDRVDKSIARTLLPNSKLLPSELMLISVKWPTNSDWIHFR